MLRYVSYGCSSSLTPWLPAILGAKLSLSYPPKTVQFLPSSSEEWGSLIQKQLSLCDDQISFLHYHSANDDDHMRQFETILSSSILDLQDMDKKIVKTAKIVARLYRLQLEEMGNV
jgi:esterase/lipase